MDLFFVMTLSAVRGVSVVGPPNLTWLKVLICYADM